jgi:hypothetical protein
MKRLIFEKDNGAIYVTPLIGFSWGEKYKKAFWIGWLYWLWVIEF